MFENVKQINLWGGETYTLSPYQLNVLSVQLNVELTS